MTMTTITRPAPGATAGWQPVETGDQTVAVLERPAIGTTARLAVWPPEHAGAATGAVDQVLAALDQQASRFRADSEISWLHRQDGGLFVLSDGLAEAVRVALEAARWTGGLVDPTVGQALIALGYDRDFAELAAAPDAPLPAPETAPGWQRVRLDGALLRLPPDVRLDLGATAKGLGADRAARAVRAACGPDGGVLVSLGGDIATGGVAPHGGWPIVAADRPDARGGPAQPVRLPWGAVATSSVTCRRWRRDGQTLHHLVDPRTGRPADGPWRSASVVAMTCADANTAATAAIIAGTGAETWLARAGLPARLTGHDGRVRCLGGWPERDGARLPVPTVTRVYGGAGPRGGAR
jgi:thiamine biosynthesis lipoprotein